VSSNSKAFQLILRHTISVDTALGINTADNLLRGIIETEEINPLYKKGAPSADWKIIYERLETKYPTLVDQIVTESKPNYYGVKKMWKEYGHAEVEYMERYGINMGNGYGGLNDHAFHVYLYCNDKIVLLKALDWSKRSFEKETDINPNFLDTYAHLWYKLGNTDNAIAWESKALSLAKEKRNDDYVLSFSKVIQRMGKGLKELDKD
jgi:hypothetical protein